MKSKEIQKVLLLVAITILLVGLASAATSNKTSTNKDTKVIKDNTKNIKNIPVTTKKASTKTVTNNKTQTYKVKEKTSEKTTRKIEKNKQKNTKTEPVTAEDWSDLQTKIEQISEDTTIILNKESSFETTQTITWNKPYTLTIDGNGQTINGNQNQVFRIEEGSTLHLKNIIITNAQAIGTNARGGALYNYYGTLTINNSTLTNNQVTATGEYAHATALGGAIYNLRGTLTINNTILTNNTVNATATREYASVNAYGGALYNNGGTLTINNSTLTNNRVNATATGEFASVKGYGGAIYNTGNNYNISDTIFYNNTPANFNIKSENKIQFIEEEGSIISIGNYSIKADGVEKTSGYGKTKLESVEMPSGDYVEIILNGTDERTLNNHFVLRFNIADVYNYTELVEAIETIKTEKYNKYIINLLSGDYNATTSINWEESATKNLIINGNNITLDGIHEHQFIRIGSGLNLTLNNITISNYNVTATEEDTNAFAEGGAIYNSGNLAITHSTLINNQVNATTTATDANEAAYADGGAIYNVGNLTITYTTLTNNTATASGEDASAFADGGAIYSQYGNVSITFTTFTNNTATATGSVAGAYGGAIHSNFEIVSITFTTLSHSTLQNNQATAIGRVAASVRGGAIYYTGSEYNYNITDTIFYKNTPANFIINETKNIQLINNDNYISIGKFTIIADGKEIGNGTKEEDLKDIIISDGYRNVEIIINGTDGKTLNNRYMLRGFSIEVHNYTELVNAIEQAQSENYDSFLINLQEGDYNATKTITLEESATKNLIINGNNNTLNGKQEHQFILIGKGLNLTLNNITITNYTAQDGGAICSGGGLIVKDSMFIENHATEDGSLSCGGAIRGVDIDIFNSTFINNTASMGGAICGVNVNISISNFTQNEAEENGGAIYIELTLNVSDSYFIQNAAKGEGGAIYLQGQSFEDYYYFENVCNHFEGNRATTETIYFRYPFTKIIKDNTYKNTTIGYTDFILNITSSKIEFLSTESLALKYNASLVHPDWYDEDILDKLTYEIIANGEIKLNVTGLTANIKLNNYRGKYKANIYNDIFQTSTNVEFTVTMPTSISMKVINNTLGNVIINVDVKDINNKYVTSGELKVYNNDKEIASIQLSGKSENITINIDKGEQKLKLEYKANSNDYYSNSTLTDEVTIVSETSLTLTTKNVYIGDSVVFNGTLKDSKGRGLNTNITVTINNKKETIQVKDGKFQVKYAPTKEETVKIVIVFSGDKYNLKSNLTKTFKVQKIKTVIIIKDKKIQNMDKVKLVATVKDQNNKKVNTGKVIFKINGITIKDENGKAITAKVSKGQATLTFTPNKDYYNKVSNITAVYSENNKFLRSESNAKLTLTPRDATIKLQSTKIKATQYDTITIKTISKDKNKAIKKGYVIFKINNKTLTKNNKTIKAKIKNGKATLKYNLNGHKTGKYTLTALLSSTPYKKVTSKTTLKITEDKMHIDAKPIKTSTNKTRIKAKILDTKNKYIKTTIKVSFKINQKTVAKQVKVKNGKINVKIPTNVTKGKHTLNIVAGPNYRYKVTRKNVSLIKI